MVRVDQNGYGNHPDGPVVDCTADLAGPARVLAAENLLFGELGRAGRPGAWPDFNGVYLLSDISGNPEAIKKQKGCD